MNTRRILVKKVEENDGQEEIPPQVEEVEQVPQGAQVYQVSIVGGGDDDPPKLSYWDIRED